ncbi:MAG: AlkA N-terminal domain-containing protein, partial [Myxococcota bacterium]
MGEGDRYWEALKARDPRFDGVFFVGVSTTGIYCRPVCPARTPGKDRCTFFRHSSEAERAGFRACLRCRPELAPGNAPVDARSRLVRRAVSRIESRGWDGSATELARSLGVTDRHLRRAFDAELGTSPSAWERGHRIGLARQLIRETSLPVEQIGAMVGYPNPRSFRAAFHRVCGRAPTEVRRGSAGGDAVVVKLAARPPYDAGSLLRFLAARQIPGVERVDPAAGLYARSTRIGPHAGWWSAAFDGGTWVVSISTGLSRAVVQVVARIRSALDLDARPDRIAEVLAADPLLGPRVLANPGLRVPGAADPFELAVRAVLGQQVSVKAATTLAGRLVERFGAPLDGPGLTAAFPTAAELAAAPVDALAAIGLPGSRARTVASL